MFNISQYSVAVIHFLASMLITYQLEYDTTQLEERILFFNLFHRRTRASYVYNGCLAWYNVVLTHGSTQA